MKKFCFPVIILLLLFSCTPPQKTTGTEKPFEIKFGHSGGFTNVTLEFIIKENREVFRTENDNLIRMNKISLKEMREIRKMIESAGFKNLKSDEPGNINYFIKVQTGEYENTVNWTPPSGNSLLNDLYLKLSETVK